MRIAAKITSALPLLTPVSAFAAVPCSLAGDSTPCPYTVVQVAPAQCPFWGAMSLRPSGMNNLGAWVGWHSDCQLENHIAIKWTLEGGIVALPAPPNTTSMTAGGINDQGTVVGNRAGVTNGQSHDYWACIWIHGEFIEIPALGGIPATSFASAVNNSNWVVGERSISENGSVGFVWRDGVITHIDPVPYGRESATPEDVSDSGFVAGYLGGSSNSTGLAFRWADAQLETLAPLPEAINSVAWGVNNGGVVVGACQFPYSGSPSAYFVPTVWAPGADPQALQLLGGYRSGTCRAITDAGLILGEVALPIQPGLPLHQDVVWIDSVPYPLKSLIDTADPNLFGTAYAMSGAGQIVGSGYYGPNAALGGAWILTPTSSPADLNNDCAVDGADLALLLFAWGSSIRSAADLDLDGKVDGADLGHLLGAWTAQE